MRATGGSQTASMRSATSRAKPSIGHGIGAAQVVVPAPRQSWVVLRKASLKYGNWYVSQECAVPPAPDTQTMSGPSPTCS